MSAAAPHDESTLREMHRNARDLRQGLAIHTLGYLGKPVVTVLLIFIVRLYGAADFGVYSLCMAMLWMTVCLCCLGFDQALLWWVPRQDLHDQRRQIRPVLLVSGVIAFLITLGTVLYPSVVEAPFRMARAWANSNDAYPLSFFPTLQIMVLGLLPQVLGEVFEAAVTGRRRLHARVFVRENLVPFTFIAAAFLLHSTSNGLAWAYVVAQYIGLAGHIVVFQISFRRSSWPQREPWMPCAQLRQYAWPMWLNSILGSFHESADLLLLSALIQNPAVIGVYVVAIRLANVVREFRGPIAQLGVAISSKALAKDNSHELTAAYAYATTLMIVLHVPLVAFIAVYGDWLLGLYGPEFLVATSALMIFCATRMVSNVFGNADLLLRGAGYSRLVLMNTLASIGILTSALCLLIPGYGILGAACGALITACLVVAIQQFEMRLLLKAWFCTSEMFQPLAVGLGIGLVMMATWAPIAFHSVPAARAAVTLVFITLYGLGLYYWWRSGMLLGVGSKSSTPAKHDRPHRKNREAARVKPLTDQRVS